MKGFKHLLEDESTIAPKYYLAQHQIDDLVFTPIPKYSPIHIIGYVECGTGCHQRSVIYDPAYMCRTITASDYRDTLRIICEPREGFPQFEYKGKTYSARHLTPREYWRIQGLSDTDYDNAFRVVASKKKMVERAGRAIFIPMLESIFKDFFERNNVTKLRVFEAFSGIGSQHIALRNIGMDCEYVGTSEVDRWGILAYDGIHTYDGGIDYSEGKTKEEMIAEMRKCNIAYNFTTSKDEMPRSESDVKALYNAHKRTRNMGDICQIDIDKMPDFDFFTYSFPCKNISVAGDNKGFKKGSGTQSSLVWECERIIREKRPKYLMMENVKNIVGKTNSKFFNEWCNILRSYGYVNEWNIYNACDYGIDQNRERVIMMSKLITD